MAPQHPYADRCDGCAAAAAAPPSPPAAAFATPRSDASSAAAAAAAGGPGECAVCLAPGGPGDDELLVLSTGLGGCGHAVCRTCAPAVVDDARHRGDAPRCAHAGCGAVLPERCVLLLTTAEGYVALNDARAAAACRGRAFSTCPRCSAVAYVDAADLAAMRAAADAGRAEQSRLAVGARVGARGLLGLDGAEGTILARRGAGWVVQWDTTATSIEMGVPPGNLRHLRGPAERPAVPVPGVRAECRSCGHQYCARCGADRWHHHLRHPTATACGDVIREKELAWLQWRAHGQDKYLAQLRKIDEEYCSKLKVYEDHEQKRMALVVFEQDEQAKRNWRHCPHCHALWGGTDACDSVTCGYLELRMGPGLSGKKGKMGCGKPFIFSQGKPYAPAHAGDKPAALEKPRAPDAVTHAGVFCAKCSVQIRGLRFRCLHCPRYDLCLPCLSEHGPGHDAEAAWPGRGRPHVFDILTDADPDVGWAELLRVAAEEMSAGTAGDWRTAPRPASRSGDAFCSWDCAVM